VPGYFSARIPPRDGRPADGDIEELMAYSYEQGGLLFELALLEQRSP